MPSPTAEQVKALMDKPPDQCSGRELAAQRKVCGYSIDQVAGLLKVTPLLVNAWECGKDKPTPLQCQQISQLYRTGDGHEIHMPVESRKPTPWAVRCSKGCNRRDPIFMNKASYEYDLQQNKGWTCPRCGSKATFDESIFRIHQQEPPGEPDGPA